MCENLRLSLPSPEKTWTGEGGGINSGGDIEAHTCLMRFLTNLARLCASKSANGPRKNSFRPYSPLTTTFNQGRKTQPSPSPHRTWSVPDASSTPQLNPISTYGSTAVLILLFYFPNHIQNRPVPVLDNAGDFIRAFDWFRCSRQSFGGLAQFLDCDKLQARLFQVFF